MSVFKEYESSSPSYSDSSSTGPQSRYTRAMNYYEHVKKLHILTCSPESNTDLSPLPNIGFHSRTGSKDSATSFSLRDISNSKDLGRVHRRNPSKLINFEEGSGCLCANSVSSSINFPGPQSRHASKAQESKDGSLGLISEFPSSLYEENGHTFGSDSSRSAPLTIDIDLRSQGKDCSTIISNLSSDSSGLRGEWEAERSAVAYISATEVPIKAPLEINLYESQSMDFRGSRSSVKGKKLYCEHCQSVVVPIVSFQPSLLPWWQRLLNLGELIRCCHEPRLGQDDVVHSCRRCGSELRRSHARRPTLDT